MRPQPQASVFSQPPQTSRWFYLATLLLAAACLWQAAPKSTHHTTRLSLANEAHAAAAPVPTSPKVDRVLETTPIQDIRTGMKVLGENPELTGLEIEEERITPETHRNVVLVANKPDGGRVEMTLLKSLSWIAEVGAEPGTTIDLTLTEIEAADEAEVRAIEPCPPLEDGPGHFVTGTFKHTATNVVDLFIEGIDKPIGTTSNHPFWSEDRQEFVSAIYLRHDERLRQANGAIARVLAQQRLADKEVVYNLEIAGQHVYCVGSDGLLVHNSCTHNRHYGNWAGDHLGNQLDRIPGIRVVGREVYVRVPNMGNRRLDLVVEINGKLYGIEAKSGNAVRSASQKAKDAVINGGGCKAFGKSAIEGQIDGREIEGVFAATLPGIGS